MILKKIILQCTCGATAEVWEGHGMPDCTNCKSGKWVAVGINPTETRDTDPAKSIDQKRDAFFARRARGFKIVGVKFTGRSQYDVLNSGEEMALQLRQEKKTFNQIGSSLRVGPNRAREIFMKAHRKNERYETRDSDPFYGLKRSTASAIIGARLVTRKDIVSAIKSGEIWKTHRIGIKATNEICRWLGLDPVIDGRKKWKFDPFTGKPLASK